MTEFGANHHTTDGSPNIIKSSSSIDQEGSFIVLDVDTDDDSDTTDLEPASVVRWVINMLATDRSNNDDNVNGDENEDELKSIITAQRINTAQSSAYSHRAGVIVTFGSHQSAKKALQIWERKFASSGWDDCANERYIIDGRRVRIEPLLSSQIALSDTVSVSSTTSSTTCSSTRSSLASSLSSSDYYHPRQQINRSATSSPCSETNSSSSSGKSTNNGPKAQYRILKRPPSLQTGQDASKRDHAVLLSTSHSDGNKDLGRDDIMSISSSTAFSSGSSDSNRSSMRIENTLSDISEMIYCDSGHSMPRNVNDYSSVSSPISGAPLSPSHSEYSSVSEISACSISTLNLSTTASVSSYSGKNIDTIGQKKGKRQQRVKKTGTHRSVNFDLEKVYAVVNNSNKACEDDGDTEQTTSAPSSARTYISDVGSSVSAHMMTTTDYKDSSDDENSISQSTDVTNADLLQLQDGDERSTHSTTVGNHSTDFNERPEIRYPGGYNRRLFVGKLPFLITEDDLCNHFIRYGRLLDVYIPRVANKSKGFGFLTFDMLPEDTTIFTDIHEISGKQIVVDEAEPKSVASKNVSTMRVQLPMQMQQMHLQHRFDMNQQQQRRHQRSMPHTSAHGTYMSSREYLLPNRLGHPPLADGSGGLGGYYFYYPVPYYIPHFDHSGPPPPMLHGFQSHQFGGYNHSAQIHAPCQEVESNRRRKSALAGPWEHQLHLQQQQYVASNAMYVQAHSSCYGLLPTMPQSQQQHLHQPQRQQQQRHKQRQHLHSSNKSSSDKNT